MGVGKQRFFLKSKILRGYLIVLLLLPASLFGQGLCNAPAGTEVGGFTLLTPAVGCSPFNVRIQDNSGGTDVEYYYYYTGQSANDLNSLTPTTALEETYFAATKPTAFTILQKGKKNGKDMFFCKNITVRPNNQPLFSYTVCGSIVEINIPKDSLFNDFDYYEVSWGGANPQIVAKSELPFNDNKTIPASRNIKVEGFFNSAGLNCAAPASINIPAYTPSNFPAGYNKANHPNIESIELTEKGKAKLVITGSLVETGYELYMTVTGQDYTSTPFKTGIKPGKFMVNLPDTVNQYCFKLQRNVANCGIEVSGEVCITTLQSVVPVEKDYEIIWQVYPEEMTGIPNTPAFGRFVTHQETIIITTNGTSVPPIAADSYDGQYISSVDCKERVCYKIETKTKGQLFYHAFESKSISNEICVDRKDFNPPALTAAYSSVNAPNSIEISYTDDSGWDLVKEKFRLLRFNGNDYIPVDSSNSITGFTDINVSTADSSYCYKINYTDECTSTSLNSPEFCTIHLSSDDQKEINWNPESPFADDVPVTYEVIYFNEVTGIPVKETDYPFPTETHPVNLDLFEEFARYQIKTISDDGRESLSNIIEIPIKASIFLPNVFTPNNDGLNDELSISGNFGRVTAYQLIIYNRWGETIFSTDNLTEDWNGQINGKPLPAGNYTFQINAETNTGEAIQKKGVVLLMR
jgi:gliding motility-associated-like protein